MAQKFSKNKKIKIAFFSLNWALTSMNGHAIFLLKRQENTSLSNEKYNIVIFLKVLWLSLCVSHGK